MLEQSPSSHYLHHRKLKKLCSFIITERCIKNFGFTLNFVSRCTYLFFSFFFLGKAGSAKLKWELGIECLPYLSVLAILHFFGP